MTSHIDHPDMIPDSALDERLPRAARLAGLMGAVPHEMAVDAIRVMREKEEAAPQLVQPSLYERRNYFRPDPDDPTGTRTLPIRRAQPKRPAGISARQWRKQRGKGGQQ